MWRKTANKNRQVYANHHPKALEKYLGKKIYIGPQLNGAGNLVTKEIEKAEIFSAFFALITTGKTTRPPQAPKTSDKA